MKDLLDKLSSYNIFNYLLPGVLFAVIVDGFTSFHILQKDIAAGVFVYYFLGSFVSRIGSLVIEPLLRKWGIVKFAPYEDFVKASKTDPKIEILSEANNMYRTICSLMLCASIVALYDRAYSSWSFLHTATPAILITVIFSVYLLSYRKQTAYIAKRIEASTSKDQQ